MFVFSLYFLGWAISVAVYLYYNRSDFDCYEFVWRSTIIEAMCVAFFWPFMAPVWLVYISIVYFVKLILGKSL